MSLPDPGDLAALTAALVDVPSVSGDEGPLATLVLDSLAGVSGLELLRDGDAVLARTAHGHPERVLLAGHLDTVPVAGNLPSRRAGGVLHGCGTSDMKGGIAVMLAVAHASQGLRRDLTLIFYDQEEVAAERNGLGRLARTHPEWLEADLAVLLEPTNGRPEAGCQGTLRAEVEVTGRRAHSARAWLGVNAVHEAAPLLQRLRDYPARTVELEGCRYREGLSAVRIEGGVAGNVVPDRCVITVNYRFAPDRTAAEALAHVEDVCAPWPVRLTDSAPPAPPGLSSALVAELVARSGAPALAKLGWTDVARFAALAIPAVNFGPGDPELAHSREESLQLDQLERCREVLAGLLGAAPAA